MYVARVASVNYYSIAACVVSCRESSKVVSTVKVMVGEMSGMWEVV